MKSKKLLAIVVFSKHKNSIDTNLYLGCNQIPEYIDILDYFYDKNIKETKIIEHEITQNKNNLYKVASISKSNFHIIDHASRVLKYENVLYSHHDIYNLHENSYSEIYLLCKKRFFESFGIIGFNIYHDLEVQNWQPNKNTLATTGRSLLQKGDGWYRNYFSSNINYKNYPKSYAFSVEIPFWVICLINRNSLMNLKYNSKFDFFYCLDDLSLEFLKNNIHNICIPWISFAHQQTLSLVTNNSYKSPMSKKALTIMNKSYEEWENKWKFPFLIYKRDKNRLLSNKLRFLYIFIHDFLSLIFKYTHNPESRVIIEKKKLVYSFSNIMREYFYHNSRKGPLKIFYKICK